MRNFTTKTNRLSAAIFSALTSVADRFRSRTHKATSVDGDPTCKHSFGQRKSTSAWARKKALRRMQTESRRINRSNFSGGRIVK